MLTWSCFLGRHTVQGRDVRRIDLMLRQSKGKAVRLWPWSRRSRLPRSAESLHRQGRFVYICCSRAPSDTAYVERLATGLDRASVPSWHDREPASADRWDQILRDRIDSCAAFIVVMSPDAAKSEWVDREIVRARRTGRPIHPLLLDGEVLASLHELQHEVVTDRSMPSGQFVLRLRARLQEPGSPSPLPSQRLSQDLPSHNRFIFVSYSHAPTDAAYMERLSADLGHAGVPIWYDRELATGDRWDQILRDRIDSCAAFVVVMSPDAAKSEWVDREIRRAARSRRRIYPLQLNGEALASLNDVHHEPITDAPAVSAWLTGELRARLAETAEMPTRSPRHFIGLVPAQSAYFGGRESLLAHIDRVLDWGGRVVTLQGVGGAGKTQLAAEYARRHLDHYDLVAWVNAETRESLIAGVAALAPALEVPDDLEPFSAAEAVVTALHHATWPWLIVFDNANYADEVGRFLPQSDYGHVIITCRSAGPDALGTTLDVELSHAEAIELLRDHAPTGSERDAASLAAQLGNLPLAVRMAGAYLADQAISLPTYEARLRTWPEGIDGDATDHRHSLSTTVQRIREDLVKECAVADQLLQLCAFLGSKSVPIVLFTDHPTALPTDLGRVFAEESSFARTVDALSSRSLAQNSRDGLTVHRLVAATVRAVLSDDERDWAVETDRELLYQHLVAKIADTSESPTAWAALLPHVLAATAHAAPHIGEKDRTSWLLEWASTYLRTHNEPGTAYGLLERAFNINEEAFGPDTPQRTA
jgi:TIR domain-containing protein